MKHSPGGFYRAGKWFGIQFSNGKEDDRECEQYDLIS